MYLHYRGTELITKSSRSDEANAKLWLEDKKKVFNKWEDGDILIIARQPLRYPKILGNTLVEMTREEVCATGDLSILEIGEVYQDGKIIIKEKPNGIDIQWEYPDWVEKATDLDKVQKQYIEYWALNNPLDFETMEQQGVLEDYKTFMKENKEYLELAKARTVLSEIPVPSEKLQDFFNKNQMINF